MHTYTDQVSASHASEFDGTYTDYLSATSQASSIEEHQHRYSLAAVARSGTGECDTNSAKSSFYSPKSHNNSPTKSDADDYVLISHSEKGSKHIPASVSVTIPPPRPKSQMSLYSYTHTATPSTSKSPKRLAGYPHAIEYLRDFKPKRTLFWAASLLSILFAPLVSVTLYILAFAFHDVVHPMYTLISLPFLTYGALVWTIAPLGFRMTSDGIEIYRALPWRKVVIPYAAIVSVHTFQVYNTVDRYQSERALAEYYRGGSAYSSTNNKSLAQRIRKWMKQLFGCRCFSSCSASVFTLPQFLCVCRKYVSSLWLTDAIIIRHDLNYSKRPSVASIQQQAKQSLSFNTKTSMPNQQPPNQDRAAVRTADTHTTQPATSSQSSTTSTGWLCFQKRSKQQATVRTNLLQSKSKETVTFISPDDIGAFIRALSIFVDRRCLKTYRVIDDTSSDSDSDSDPDSNAEEVAGEPGCANGASATNTFNEFHSAHSNESTYDNNDANTAGTV